MPRRLPLIPWLPRTQDVVFKQPWPALDESALEMDTAEVVLQVSGKTRGTLVVASHLVGDEDGLLAAARASDVGRRWLDGKR